MDKELLQDLINKNYSSHQIAKKICKSQTTVCHWFKKYGLKTNHKSIKNGGGNALKKERIILENGAVSVICPKCKELKEFTSKNFYIRKDGGFHCWCKLCSGKRTTERLRNYKLQAVEYKGGKCQSCGYEKYFGALEFHHSDPSKKDFTPSRSSRSFKNLKPEIDKCILLCANCHREVHAGLIIL